MKRRTNATNITPPRAKRSMAPAQDLDQNIVALAEQERHRTLVLLGLPESAAALPSERVQEDRKVATKILDHLDVEAEPTAVVAMNCCCLYIIFALCIFFISHLRSADFGRDLSSVQLLPNKLDTFDNGLNTSERWDQLKAALIEKRSKLGESQTLQQFSRDADEVENWIAEKFQVAQEETSRILVHQLRSPCRVPTTRLLVPHWGWRPQHTGDAARVHTGKSLFLSMCSLYHQGHAALMLGTSTTTTTM
ncbi:hypothetical protein niasHT_011745 [Heterodera trifolii]|uniref:Uncharacterized protein n=1 Tax=Heterodera trifolii TaxID=157864 RepID=A0ABD2LGM6_9BILA